MFPPTFRDMDVLATAGAVLTLIGLALTGLVPFGQAQGSPDLASSTVLAAGSLAGVGGVVWAFRGQPERGGLLAMVAGAGLLLFGPALVALPTFVGGFILYAAGQPPGPTPYEEEADPPQRLPMRTQALLALDVPTPRQPEEPARGDPVEREHRHPGPTGEPAETVAPVRVR